MDYHRLDNLSGLGIYGGTEVIGRRFENLVVLEKTIKRTLKKDSYGYICKCDCGETRFVQGAHLISGAQKSCGCMRGKRLAGIRWPIK